MEDDEVFQHSPIEFYYPDENFDETSIEASRIKSVRSAKEMMPYNKLLTNLACSSRTGEYWPSVVFVRNSLRSVRTVTTSGQYSPVRPSRSISKRLIMAMENITSPIDSIKSHLRS